MLPTLRTAKEKSFSPGLAKHKNIPQFDEGSDDDDAVRGTFWGQTGLLFMDRSRCQRNSGGGCGHNRISSSYDDGGGGVFTSVSAPREETKPHIALAVAATRVSTILFRFPTLPKTEGRLRRMSSPCLSPVITHVSVSARGCLRFSPLCFFPHGHVRWEGGRSSSLGG